MCLSTGDNQWPGSKALLMKLTLWPFPLCNKCWKSLAIAKKCFYFIRTYKYIYRERSFLKVCSLQLQILCNARFGIYCVFEPPSAFFCNVWDVVFLVWINECSLNWSFVKTGTTAPTSCLQFHRVSYGFFARSLRIFSHLETMRALLCPIFYVVTYASTTKWVSATISLCAVPS